MDFFNIILEYMFFLKISMLCYIFFVRKNPRFSFLEFCKFHLSDGINVCTISKIHNLKFILLASQARWKIKKKAPVSRSFF